MKLLENVLTFLLALAILAGLGAGVYFAVGYLVGRLGESDARWTDLIIAVCACVLVVACVIIAAARALACYQHLYRSRLEKARVYERFLGAIADLLTVDVSAAGIESLRAAEREMILWASSNVLQKYARLQDSLAEQDGVEPVPNRIDTLLKEMRRELGLSTFGLEDFQLTRLLMRSRANSETEDDHADFTTHSDLDPHRASESKNEFIHHGI